MKIYEFGFGKAKHGAKDAALLGGKGANLCQMDAWGVPVPPGVIIGTDLWREYRESDSKSCFTNALATEVLKWKGKIEKKLGRKILVSVRSGAPVSMPGMMDTILNVGISAATLTDYFEDGDEVAERYALDSYRRFLSMFGEVVGGADAKSFAMPEGDLTLEDLANLCIHFETFRPTHVDMENPVQILAECIAAVFDSWDTERAIFYRKENGISDDLGTAVTIQMMVNGNRDDWSGTGVYFTRNPSTGEDVPFGEFLLTAQGEDVVAGTVTPDTIEKLAEAFPRGYEKLLKIGKYLEAKFADVQDIEFTIESGKLWILQTRSAKRTALAKVVTALDLYNEKRISVDTLSKRVSYEDLLAASSPVIDAGFKVAPGFKGYAASPGIVWGYAVKSAAEAVSATEPVILVTEETTPNDIEGMAASVGILTETGGVTSHAAVVARAMDKPSVVGCGDLSGITAGEKVTINGSTGEVWVGIDVPVTRGSNSVIREFEQVILNADQRLIKTSSLDQDRAYVVAADWGTDVMGGISKFIKGLKKRGHTAGIVLDLRTPYVIGKESDLVLWDAFGDSQSVTDLFLDTVLTSLNGVDTSFIEGLLIKLPDSVSAKTRKSFLARGCRAEVEVKTVKDLFSDGYKLVSDEFITNVMGGKAAWNKFLKLTNVKVDDMPTPVSRQEVLVDRLTSGVE